MQLSLGRFHFGALLCFVGLNLADIASTLAATQRGLVEGNYVPAALQALGGEPAMYGFKILMVWLVVAVVLRLTATYTRLWYALHTANAFMVVVVASNLLALYEAGAL